MPEENKESQEAQENQIVIDEPIEETSSEDFSIEGLSDGEVELAKEHGLYTEPVDKKPEDTDGKHTEQPEPKTKEDTKEEKEDGEEEEVDNDPDNFEAMDEVFEKNEKSFHKNFSSNQKALYFKNKVEKKKRQEAVAERDDLRTKIDLLKDSSLSTSKIDKISKLLADPDNLPTFEELQAVLKEQKEEVEDEPKVDTTKLQQKVADKIAFSEKIGKSQYENFDVLIKLAGEMFNNKPRYQKHFDSMLLDDTDENELVDYVVDIAKLHKDYGKPKVDPKDKEEVNRILKNSKKKVSSAAVGGTSGRRIISEDELTCDQVSYKAKTMSTAEYDKFFDKLKPATQARIMKGIDP